MYEVGWKLKTSSTALDPGARSEITRHCCPLDNTPNLVPTFYNRSIDPRAINKATFWPITTPSIARSRFSDAFTYDKSAGGSCSVWSTMTFYFNCRPGRQWGTRIFNFGITKLHALFAAGSFGSVGIKGRDARQTLAIKRIVVSRS